MFNVYKVEAEFGLSANRQESQVSRSKRQRYLKLHGDVLLVLWRRVALLVVGEVVGRAGVDDRRLR